MDYLEILNKSEYSNKIIDYLKLDMERVNETNEGILYSNVEFPINEPLLLFEPRVILIISSRFNHRNSWSN